MFVAREFSSFYDIKKISNKIYLQIVNTYGGEVDTSSLDVEETLPRDTDNGGINEGDDKDEDDESNESDESYDSQHVTVPRTAMSLPTPGAMWPTATPPTTATSTAMYSQWVRSRRGA